MPINYFDIKNGVIAYSQKNYQLKRHGYFPIEVVFALSGQVNIVTDKHQYTNIQSAIINSNAPHTFSCLNGACQLYFIDPTSYAGRHVLTCYRFNNDNLALLNNIEVDCFKEKHILPFEKYNKYFGEIDSRVQRCMDWINENYAKEGINMAMIAENTFLSAS
ncbi:MAG TPA: hypothetical protein VFX43_11040 [Chitinophagaceae bacterium]|nr:hypothetical protein [Chitinophagaceae bacterium]